MFVVPIYSLELVYSSFGSIWAIFRYIGLDQILFRILDCLRHFVAAFFPF